LGKIQAKLMRTFYYSTKRSVDMCKEGFEIITLAERENRLDGIIAVDLGNDSQSAQRYQSRALPVLSLDGSEFFGTDALAKLALLVGIDYTHTPVEDDDPDPTGLPPIPEDNEERQQESPNYKQTFRSEATRPGRTPSMYSVEPVAPTHVLYTNDTPADIHVPANGLIKVQPYDLIMATYGATVNNYLKKAGPGVDATKRRALPILVTMGEAVPTIWYGTAARDHCKVLCSLNGGAMI
jgi:hypothetical protein